MALNNPQGLICHKTPTNNCLSSSLSINQSLSINIYMYVCIYMCVCVCVYTLSHIHCIWQYTFDMNKCYVNFFLLLDCRLTDYIYIYIYIYIIYIYIYIYIYILFYNSDYVKKTQRVQFANKKYYTNWYPGKKFQKIFLKKD